MYRNKVLLIILFLLVLLTSSCTNGAQARSEPPAEQKVTRTLERHEKLLHGNHVLLKSIDKGLIQLKKDMDEHTEAHK